MFETLLKIIIGFLQFIELTYFLVPKAGIGGAIEALEKVDVGELISYSLIFLFMMAFLVGIGLALTARKFAVQINPVVEKVRDILPGANCGACGYAGCMGYAEAVAGNPDVPANLCAPGKAHVAEAIASLTGKEAGKIEPRIARIFCQGDERYAQRRFLYQGIRDCTAAILAGGGDKACIYGCLGYGTCMRACPFGAITMSEYNLPLIDPELCTACGKCVEACPKQIIDVLPSEKEVLITCHSKERGAQVKKNCQVGCTACGICVKTCPFDAITIADNLARVNIEKCTLCGLCIRKCPSKTILDYIPERGKAVILEGCMGYDVCSKLCPVNAPSGAIGEVHTIDPSKCIGCGICVLMCPAKAITGTFNAVKVEPKAELVSV